MSHCIITCTPSTVFARGYDTGNDDEATWWVVGEFASDVLRTQLACRWMTQGIQDTFGPRSVITLETAGPPITLVIVPPNSDILTLVKQQAETLCSEGWSYKVIPWPELEPHIQAHWDGCDAVDRILLVRRALANDALIMRERCPIVLWPTVKAELLPA